MSGDQIGSPDGGLRAFVLCGGLGTRLRPILSDRPKSMAVVAGVPFLQILLKNLRVQGVAEVVLGTGYMAEQIESKNRATSSEETRAAVLAKCKTEGIESMLLWFNDLEGHLKSFAITPDELEGALDDGMGFDGSSITGFNAIEESDMVAIPDPETFVVMPWRSGESKVGRMICDVVTPDGNPYDGDPRHVLRRALERMQELGFDTFNVGPELEYFLFTDDKATEPLDEGGYFAMGRVVLASQSPSGPPNTIVTCGATRLSIATTRVVSSTFHIYMPNPMIFGWAASKRSTISVVFAPMTNSWMLACACSSPMFANR